jgi:hypothetical protein
MLNKFLFAYIIGRVTGLLNEVRAAARRWLECPELACVLGLCPN